MENLFLYAIFDEGASQYGPIYEAPNDRIASRKFLATIQPIDPRFRVDYKLMCVGQFNPRTGELKPVEMNYEVTPEYQNNEKIKEIEVKKHE